MNPSDQIFACFDRHGRNDYGRERVCQIEHALQTATLAEDEGAAPALITAALLHDISCGLVCCAGDRARALARRRQALPDGDRSRLLRGIVGGLGA
jgi:predicted HD phosphohydrolase